MSACLRLTQHSKKDEQLSKEELIQEIHALRSRVNELEFSQTSLVNAPAKSTPTHILDLFDLEEIQTVQNAFSDAVGVTSIITDHQGNEITHASNELCLCSSMVRKTEQGRNQCLLNQEGFHIAGDATHEIHECVNAGLLEGVARIFAGRLHIGNWIVGKVRDENEDIESLVEAGMSLGFDENLVRESLLMTPAMSRAGFERICKALHVFSQQLSEMALQRLQMRKAIQSIRVAESLRIENENQYSKLFQAALEAVFLFDCESLKILQANTAAIKMYGYSLEEITEMTVDELSSEPEQTRLSFTLRRTKIPLRYHRKKDGAPFPIEGFLSFFELGGREVAIGIARDVSDRLRMEEQLRHSQKMEAIGRLAGGVAHDFNNLLSGVIGHLYLAESASGEGGTHSIQQARKSADRCAELVQQLLVFGRRVELNRQTTDLTALAEDAAATARATLDQRIRLEVEPAGPIVLSCDETKVHSVLLNLINNARDAILDVLNGSFYPERIHDEFRIELATGTEMKTPPHVNADNIPPCEYACVSVSDNGKGMDQATKSQAFEPFFTTKQVGKGTGLGLASAYGIVHQHDGWIELDSRPGMGTRFTLYFPLGELV
ncbi:MAG: PAS domain S-box protein [bacterium]|nr:PAS domain S-box protein [bacterium]